MTTTTLPVPVRFILPGDEWTPVDPTSLGVSNAAFLAVRRGFDDYSPTITVSGDWRPDPATLDEIGDESVRKLRDEGATEVELLKRTQVGTEHVPGVTQSIGAVVAVEGRRFDVRQAQAIQGLVDAEDPTRRAVIIYTLSCTYRQWEPMVREFQEFMASVEVVTEPPAQV